MRSLHVFLLVFLLTGGALALPFTLSARGAPPGPHGPSTAADWQDDPVWYDGKAECCVYAAERVIYGRPREYEARVYTNKQRMDPTTTVKADGGSVEVFKHHWSERVPTERYDYDFSTAVFLESDDLALFKLTAATQEDCGASFKQLWREDRENRWMESVYFPGAGMAEGRFSGRVVAEDSLPLFLRRFPFARGVGASIPIKLLPSQKSTRRVPWKPVDVKVTLVETAAVDLPLGRREAHHLRLEGVGHNGADFWFAADGSAPSLHVLLAYEDAQGTKARLKRHERRAYWAE